MQFFRRTHTLLDSARTALISAPDVADTTASECELWLHETLKAIEAAQRRCASDRYLGARSVLDKAVGALYGVVLDFDLHARAEVTTTALVRRFTRTTERLAELEKELSTALGWSSLAEAPTPPGHGDR
ncbi:hypothetical protein [Amycolatopsis sp. NPDC059657]|uniref:hypothetical protein n=1 Tax=Amycolatopsis sp. NPDC059657 TaxID=3346899 RepID=UPI00366AFB48